MYCLKLAVLQLLLLLLLPQAILAVTIVDHHPDDEYVIDHQVPYEKALAEALDLKLYPGPIPGCKACTREEMSYCRDGSVLEDHCCCDGAYNEVLGFVEHTCRVGPEACHVRAGDCAEYTRVRECCCHSFLASLWKHLAGGAESARVSRSLFGIVFLLAILQAVR